MWAPPPRAARRPGGGPTDVRALPGSLAGCGARNVKKPVVRIARVRPAMQLLKLLSRLVGDLEGDASLAALASRGRRSPSGMHRAFRALVGETAKQYTLRLRLERAAAALLAGRARVLDVALDSGFA